MADLDAAVGGAVPDEFAALAQGQRTALAELVEAAAKRRAALLDRAIDDSLRYLPALLRGTVRRTLGV